MNVHLTHSRMQNIVEAIVKRATESTYTIEDLIGVGLKAALEAKLRHKFRFRELKFEVRKLYRQNYSISSIAKMLKTSRKMIGIWTKDMPPNLPKKIWLKYHANQDKKRNTESAREATHSLVSL